MRATKAYRLSLTEEAKQILSRLTLEQKVDLMGANFYMDKLQELMDSLGAEDSHYNITPYAAGGIDGVIPPVQFCDGPRGVVCGIGQTTCFPVSMARGATFDPALEEEIGHAIGREVRAFGGNLFAGVCINLPYNPGWGRSQETYGEETTHIGAMGAALVRGVQSEDIMACVKHFAFNNMEKARFTVSVTCDQRTEKEVMLPHFKDCLDAGAASIMSSYNRYNGVQCGHHHYLLTEVLKGEWDFDGFVMSDFIWGVKDTVEAANGGQDIEMMLTNFFGEKLIRAVKDGFVPESRIDDAALRIVRTILAFDRGHKEYDMSVVGCREHIALAKKADVFVIAPATANVIAKVAHGIADDMLTSTFLAATCEKLVVPAMNTHMLENPATQENIETLRRRGIHILDSDSGYLACGDTGKGRMPEASVIYDAVCSLMESDRWLAGKKIVVTAGPTRESLDPVRFITNHSSGKMGYALARAARDLGADVTLVTGRTNLAAPVNVEVVDVESAGGMADAVLSRFADCDAAIFAAAVADYKPADYSDQKIKKKDGDLALPLARTVDILKTCGERKQNGQKLIGFAMETQDLLKNARVKLEKKNADFIVANTLTEAGAGFGVDTNHVTILSPDGEHDLGQLSKEETARKILEFCLR